MNEEIKKLLKKTRPSLSASSLTTYASILKNLYKSVFGDPEDTEKKYEFNESDFDRSKDIIDHLKTLEPNKRKTVLSALVVLTDKPEYRELMLSDIKEYNKDILKQEKTEGQEDSWLSQEEINKLIDELKADSTFIYKKSSPTMTDIQSLQNYIILCLLGGKYIPPRRSKDYVDFKIKNIDTKKDNYISGNKFIFNSYKTAKTYGQQQVDIPKELKTIITKWVKLNPTEYLLFDSKKNQLSNVKLNQRLNKLFKKHSAVNALRHTFLTEKYGHSIEERNEMEKDFKDMGSSKAMEKTYIKKVNKSTKQPQSESL